jgi:Uma2 family endonuclease
MNEYLSCGLPLGWLIVPASSQVEVYTSLGLKVLTTPETVSADTALAGFKLELNSVWNPPF